MTDTMTGRYQRAATLMQGIFTKNLVRNTTVFSSWINDSDCFWYERETTTAEENSVEHSKKSTTTIGKEYRLVNAQAVTNEVAFDHSVLAAALAEAVKQEIDSNNLPITKVKMALSSSPSTTRVTEICFRAFDKHWVFNTTAATCTTVDCIANNERVSPDGKNVVFRRDFNLWMRNINSGEERAITQDGEKDYVYGAPGSAWGSELEMDQRPQAIWSPDSSQLFTVQRDTRQVLTLPIVRHVPKDGSVRPTVKHIKIAYPGDDHVETLRLVAIHCETGRIQAVNYRQIPTTRNGYGFFSSNFGWWSTDSCRAYFVDMERSYQTVRVVEVNTETGTSRTLFTETSQTQINLMLNGDEPPTFMPLPDSNELLWFSERSGWAHLYLYDLDTGKLKNTVTKGDWLVRDIVHFNADRREVFVQTAGRERDRDPYYRDLACINIDTSEINTLASSDHEYWVVAQKNMSMILANMYGNDASCACGVSPSGDFAVVNRSRADEMPVSLLLDRDGNTLLDIETADIAGLPDNWQWPEPIKLLAADNKTDIFGLVFRPSDFSPEHSYPIISHVYSTPDMPFVSKGSFTNGSIFGWPYLDAAALAELGFIVVQIDGRGASYRHKAFQDESYGSIESACNLDDYVAGIQQLAHRYPYMDLKRVGISSQFSGGPGGVQGLLQHPEFFKVGVNGFLHDGRLMPASMWGDKLEGLSGPRKNHQHPEKLADNLQGKLLLMHGMLDDSTAPAGMFRVVEALQKSNKDFDLLLMPNVGHDTSSYQIRRAWDYLVRYLLELEPPKEFELTTGFDSF